MQMMQNPQILAALQERLDGLVGSPSGYMERYVWTHPHKYAEHNFKWLPCFSIGCIRFPYFANTDWIKCFYFWTHPIPATVHQGLKLSGAWHAIKMNENATNSRSEGKKCPCISSFCVWFDLKCCFLWISAQFADVMFIELTWNLS